MRIEELAGGEHPELVDKLESKHPVQIHEVEQTVLDDAPQFRHGRDGTLYPYGTTNGGRYLFTVLRPLSGGLRGSSPNAR